MSKNKYLNILTNDARLEKSWHGDKKRGNIFSRFTSHLSLRAAFSLAEVLITIGILGVVAAITISNLIANYQKSQTAIQLKKAYTTLSSAVQQSEKDNGPCKYWNQGIAYSPSATQQSFDTYWAPYIKVLKMCNSLSDCGYTLLNYNFLSGAQDTGGLYIIYPQYRTTLILPDGSVLIVSPYYAGNLKKYVFVDLNGWKKPNMWGKDVFWFVLEDDKGLMPYSSDASETEVNSNCKKGAVGGSLCATKIMRDGWKISDDYPW